MKLITRFALIALLPLLSGCLSMSLKEAANRHVVKTPLYDSVDRIEKAAVIKGDKLYILFEKDLTNSVESRFALLIPIAVIRTNAHEDRSVYTSGIMRSPDNYGLYTNVTVDKTNPLSVRCIISSATLRVPGSTIRTNWMLPDNSAHDLKDVPIGALTLKNYEHPVYYGLNLTLLPNATETVYLTKTAPVEFTYIDASIKRSMTVIRVDPYLISSTRTDHLGIIVGCR